MNGGWYCHRSCDLDCAPPTDTTTSKNRPVVVSWGEAQLDKQTGWP